MLDIQKLLVDGGILIAMITAIILSVGVKRPRWFLEKKNVPADILAAVPPRTEEERRASRWAAIPMVLVLLGGLVWSTYTFGQQSGAGFLPLFLHAAILVVGVSTFDLVVIDWLVLNTITPKWAVYPGTEGFAGYKDYGFHGRAHLRALPAQVIFAALVAVIVGLISP